MKSNIGKVVYVKSSDLTGILDQVILTEDGSLAHDKGYIYIIVLKDINGITGEEEFITLPANPSEIELSYFH